MTEEQVIKYCIEIKVVEIHKKINNKKHVKTKRSRE
jgi:hypothetical protein